MAAAAPSPGPGLYTEIGKKARDLLYKDYHTDQKFTLTTYAANGAAITAASTKKGEALLSEIQSQLKTKNFTVDVKATSDSNVLTTITFPDVLGTPGLKGILSIPVPFQKIGKAELQYLHAHAGISASVVGHDTKPVANLSGVFGSKDVAVGADIAFDTASGELTKYNAGLTYTSEDLTAAVTLNNKGDSAAFSYFHQVQASTAVGAEFAHSFKTNENTVTFGTQHALDPLTSVKARMNNNGIASALIQHEWRPKSLIAVSTEVDTKAIEKSSKVGLSLVLKP